MVGYIAVLLSAALLVGNNGAHAIRDGTGRRLLDDGECPPPGFDALKTFDISTYISKPWYVQKQMPLAYQPKDKLFCVRATYEPLDEDNLSKGLRVLNYANEDRVNGEPVGTTSDSFFPLVAVPDEEQPAKLSVGPDIGIIPGVQQLGMGDYWVIYTNGSKPDEYDLAIVIGGPPKRETDNGCATGNKIGLLRLFQINDIGLWLFSRTPVDPEGTEHLLAVAESMGLDTTVLLPVEQEGCKYEEEEEDRD